MNIVVIGIVVMINMPAQDGVIQLPSGLQYKAVTSSK